MVVAVFCSIVVYCILRLLVQMHAKTDRHNLTMLVCQFVKAAWLDLSMAVWDIENE